MQLPQIFTTLVAIGTLLLAGITISNSQAQTASPDTQATGAKSSWSVRCAATSREAAPDCSIEQRAVVTQTGRLLMQITIRVPAETLKPVLMIQGPLGTYLPAGVTLDVDSNKFQKLEFQTCEANGCYAASPLTSDQLKQLFNGQKLNINVQSANRQPLMVPMSLIGFTSAYEKIQ
ncbi:MAG: invasion associated locus B family protein [Proteobacteria bacterium]|nr:invasion associated locus B family protein [Pseudomonadota bacterium]